MTDRDATLHDLRQRFQSCLDDLFKALAMCITGIQIEQNASLPENNMFQMRETETTAACQTTLNFNICLFEFLLKSNKDIVELRREKQDLLQYVKELETDNGQQELVRSVQP
jgi:hypothetical protein